MLLGLLAARAGILGLNKVWSARRTSKNQGVRGAGLLDADFRGRSNTRPPSGGQVAQLVEQRTENPRVGGSIPPLATMTYKKELERT